MYAIAERKAVTRAYLTEGAHTFVVDPRLGTYETRLKAKAALMRWLDPSLRRGQSDEFCATHFGKQKEFKIIKKEAQKQEEIKGA